jgi:hypothetical protein
LRLGRSPGGRFLLGGFGAPRAHLRSPRSIARQRFWISELVLSRHAARRSQREI